MAMAQKVRGDHALISNFRHPVARIFSLYEYFRLIVPETPAVMGEPAYHAVRLAKRSSLAEFVASDDPRITTYTADHHFRQLTKCGWTLEAPSSAVETLVEQLDWLYVCEYPDISMRWGVTS
jgi:hypothetical protein